jgi:hypothetical protein
MSWLVGSKLRWASPVRIFKMTEAGRKHLEQELASVQKMFAGFNRVLALVGQ